MSLADIAMRAGVSTATASKALNHYPGVSDATRQRVWDAARALQVTPRPYRALRGEAERTVVLLPLASSLFRDLQKDPGRLSAIAYQSFQQELTSQGFDLMLGPELDDEHAAVRYVHDHVGKRFAGVALIPPAGTVLAEFLQRRRIPAVCLSGSVDDPNLAVVTGDHARGTWLLMRHLVNLGHRRIGYLGIGIPSRSYIDRLQAYLAQQELNSLPRRKAWVLQPRLAERVQTHDLPSERWHHEIERFLDGLIEKQNLPTALVCVNDDFARKAIELLSVRGVAVPEDISVTGWGHEDKLPLTTVDAQPRKVGELGARWLTAMMRSRDADAGRLHVPVSLVVGDTTARPTIR